MQFSNSPKRLSMYAFLAGFAVLCLIMLAFSTISLSDEFMDHLDYFKINPDNGFKWMTFDSNMLYGDQWDTAKVPIALLSIAQLVFGLCAIAIVAYNFVSKKDDANNKIIIGGLASMTLYALEGIIVRSVYISGVSEKWTKHISTASYIPLIIGAILLAGYFAVLKYMPEDASTEFFPKTITSTASTPKKMPSKLSENERIESLVKYKNLLEQGIITQEEFDTKKKELLGL